MKRTLPWALGVSLSLTLALSFPASGGPNHGAAMAEVERGAAICPTGNLDAAMEVFRGVEGQFPDEKEAVGWARWWHSNCLLAGGRRSEVAPLMSPIWSWATAGEITNPTTAFLFGHQLARVLDRGNYLRSVCEKTMGFYGQIEAPGIQIEEKAGFLQVFLSRCYYATREYVRAAAAGQAAWERGETLRRTVVPQAAADLDVKPHVLAAWGRLEQAKAELALDNILMAQVYLAECAEEYSPQMDPGYASEVDTFREDCRLRLGFTGEVRETLLQKLESTDPSIDRGLWLRTAWGFANEAYNREATAEAIAPMAVARTCYVAFPGWGIHIDLLWQRKIRGHTPNDLFIAELERQKDTRSALQRASIRIQLAEILAELNRGPEGLALLDEVPSLSTDPRINMSLRVARAHCEFPRDREAEVRAYEEVLAEATGNRGLISYAVGRVRDSYWWVGEPEGRYRDWLDRHEPILPSDLFRLEKSEWLREWGRDAGAALETVGPLLKQGLTRWEAYVGQIVCLYRMNDDAGAAAATRAFEERYPDTKDRECLFFNVAWYLQYDRRQIALALVDRVLSTRQSTLWTEDSLLLKGRLLSRERDFEQARSTLEELASRSPSDVVGEGMVDLAGLYREPFSDLDRARGIYDAILSASDAFIVVQEITCRQYAIMEEYLGNVDKAIEICSLGLDNVPLNQVADRGWISLRRARLRCKHTDRELGLSELRAMAETHPDGRIRREADVILQQEGGR